MSRCPPPCSALARRGRLAASGGTRALALGLSLETRLQGRHEVDDLRRRAATALGRRHRAALELALDGRQARVAAAVAIPLRLPRIFEPGGELHGQIDLAPAVAGLRLQVEAALRRGLERAAARRP